MESHLRRARETRKRVINNNNSDREGDDAGAQENGRRRRGTRDVDEETEALSPKRFKPGSRRDGVSVANDDDDGGGSDASRLRNKCSRYREKENAEEAEYQAMCSSQVRKWCD